MTQYGKLKYEQCAESVHVKGIIGKSSLAWIIRAHGKIAGSLTCSVRV